MTFENNILYNVMVTNAQNKKIGIRHQLLFLNQLIFWVENYELYNVTVNFLISKNVAWSETCDEWQASCDHKIA